MNVRDLVPWTRGDRERSPTTRSESLGPVVNLHHEMNRLFDDVFRAFDTSRWAGGQGAWPSIDVEERDVEVLYQDGVLTLRGEKKLEKETNDRSVRERFYGRFERRVSLDREIDEEAISAVFRNGVLAVTLPKSAKAVEKSKRIPITSSGSKTH